MLVGVVNKMLGAARRSTWCICHSCARPVNTAIMTQCLQCLLHRGCFLASCPHGTVAVDFACGTTTRALCSLHRKCCSGCMRSLPLLLAVCCGALRPALAHDTLTFHRRCLAAHAHGPCSVDPRMGHGTCARGRHPAYFTGLLLAHWPGFCHEPCTMHTLTKSSACTPPRHNMLPLNSVVML